MEARLRRRLGLVLAAVLALSAGCSRRPSAPPGQPVPHAPASRLPGAPAPAPVQTLADPERDAVVFTHWRASHPEVEAFEEYLVREQVAQVAPAYQLLRSASMWKECKSQPFQVPPPELWPSVRDVMVLLRELQARQVLPAFEIVSAYRDPRLNRCAGGAPGSSHQVFAVDIAPLPQEEADQLCRFWREQGKPWNMGVSRYPSGRIHIDRAGWRTWGASHTRASSYCLG
ncbi:MAG: peptidase [Ramlibacter sp.]|jgi:hypothetical protein|nr:peptidase [Ramlibacter sp.]